MKKSFLPEGYTWWDSQNFGNLADYVDNIEEVMSTSFLVTLKSGKVVLAIEKKYLEED